MILPPQTPPPLQQFLDTLSWFLDRRHRISLAKRAGHKQGWQEVECFQYQHTVTKTIEKLAIGERV